MIAPASKARHWWEITVTGEPSLEECITWRLQDRGCRGTASQLQDQCLMVQAYLNPDQFQEQDLREIAVQLQTDVQGMGFGELQVNWHLVPEEDWAKSWQDHWQPQAIGKQLLIQPAWLPIAQDTKRRILQLNPGVAFGTGAHATTQLCLQALEKQLAQTTLSTSTLADIGCGSGILSIAAILLGVQQVYAVDTDPLAVDSARESRRLNAITAEQLVIEEGSCEQLLSEILAGPVDGFVCNILAEVIVTLIPHFKPLLKAGGWGLLSGILTRQIPLMAERLNAYGWQITDTTVQADWCCLQIEAAIAKEP